MIHLIQDVPSSTHISWMISPMALIFWVPALGLSGWWLRSRAEERKRRLDLVAQALNSHSTPPEVRAELLRALRPPTGRLLATIGWFGLCTGISGWSITGGRDYLPWLITTVGSFAVLTLPIVWREVEAHRPIRQEP